MQQGEKRGREKRESSILSLCCREVITKWQLALFDPYSTSVY